MKRYHRICSGAFALAIILGFFAACGSSPAASVTYNDPHYYALDFADNYVETEWVDNGKWKKDGPYKIGYSFINITDSWRVECLYNIQDACKRMGVTLYSADAENSINKQISDVQDLCTRGIDALIIDAGSTTACASVMKQAMDMGIAVIAFHNEVQDESSYISFVGADEYAYGRVIAEYLINDCLKGKGKIVNLRGLAGAQLELDRNQALMDVIAELPDGGANIEILGEYYAEYTYDLGKLYMEQALAAFPEIDGVYGSGGIACQGAVEAVLASGRKLMPITGEFNNGFVKLWKQLIDDGVEFQSIAPGTPTKMAADAVYMAVMVLNGQRTPKKYVEPVGSYTITAENIDANVRDDLNDNYWPFHYMNDDTIEKYYKEK